MLLANLYFERDEIEKLRPRGAGDKVRVEVFGEFEGKHGSWNKRYECPYDDFFVAYKCQPIGLKIGSCFKFVVTYLGGHNKIKKGKEIYLTSKRYPCKVDIHGIQTNVFDPYEICKGSTLTRQGHIRSIVGS